MAREYVVDGVVVQESSQRQYVIDGVIVHETTTATSTFQAAWARNTNAVITGTAR
jgi:hypothetical protein